MDSSSWTLYVFLLLLILGGGYFAAAETAFASVNRIRLQNKAENGSETAKTALYITEHFEGDCLLAVGDDELIKIHFHTNKPWEVLEYCATLGEIHDIVVENMQLQSEGQHG